MPDNTPIIYLIGGPNGAGKTTFAYDSSNRFFEEAHAAMLRASRQVAAENRRLGLPLIVEKPRHKRPARKPLVKGAALLQF